MKIKRKSIATVLIISLLLPFTGCSLLPELPEEIPLITPTSNPFEGETVEPSESGTPSQGVAKPTQTPTPTNTPSPTPTPTPTPTATNTPTPTPVPHEHKFELTSTYEHTVVCPLCGTAYTEFVEYTYSCRCGEDKKERTEMPAHACPTNTPTPTPTPDPVKPCDDYVWTTGSVNLREEADASSAKLTSFASGTKLHRTGIHENGWSRVEVGSYIGFISGKYVSTLSPTPTSTPTPDVTATPTPWFTDEDMENNVTRKMWIVETDFDKYGYFDGFTADFAVAEEWLIKNERDWLKDYNPDANAVLSKGYMTITVTGTYDTLIPIYNNQACNTSYPIYCYLRGGQTGRVMQAWYRFGRTTFNGLYGMWFVCNDYYEICPTYTEFMIDAKDPNHKCTVVTKDKITGAVIKTEYLYDYEFLEVKPYYIESQYLDSIYITDDVVLYDYDPTKK